MVPLPITHPSSHSIFLVFFFFKIIFSLFKFSFLLIFLSIKKIVYFYVYFLSLLYFSSKPLSAADLVLYTYLLPAFLLERNSDSWDIDVFIAVFLAVRTVPTRSSEKNKI